MMAVVGTAETYGILPSEIYGPRPNNSGSKSSSCPMRAKFSESRLMRSKVSVAHPPIPVDLSLIHI